MVFGVSQGESAQLKKSCFKQDLIFYILLLIRYQHVWFYLAIRQISQKTCQRD